MSGFEVRASYAFPEDTEIVVINDNLLCGPAEFGGSAKFPRSFTGAGNCLHGPGRREIGWTANTFDEAQELIGMLRQRQGDIDDLIVTMREL